MGVLTDFVVANAKDAQRVGDSLNPSAEFNGLEAKGVTGIELGQLYCVLEGISDRDAILDSFMTEALYQASEYGPWVHEVPQALTEWLALLDEGQLRAAAVEWVKCEELSLDGPCPPEAVEWFLRDLAKLAQQAVDQRKSILLWTSL